MPKMRIRTDDQVEVIAGKDKGKRGRVIRVDRARERVVVEGLNIVKRHQRPGPQGTGGGVIEQEAPIHVSNVALIDPESDRPTRIRVEREGGRPFRVAARSGRRID
jgi:large subunit ribosomal protein L24